jgi:hypothetical protein
MRILMTTKAGAGHFGPLIPFARAFRAPAPTSSSRARARPPRWSAPRAAAVGLRRPARAGARRDLREVRGKAPDGLIAKRVGGRRLRAHRRARRLPGILAACRAWGPTSSISETPSSPARWRPRSIGVPSVCVGISQQGKEETCCPCRRSRLEELRAPSASRPTRGRAPARPPVLHALPGALEDPPPPRSVLTRFREARRACAATGLRRPGGRAAARLRHLRLGAPSLDFFPGLYRAAIDALAPLPLRLLVTVGRDRDPADLGPVPANVRVERWVPQPTSCRTSRRWSATAARAR